jgi:hypothetical protein
VDNFDKRQAVAAELLRDAGRSDRLIAEKLGGVVSSGLVRKVRQKLEQEGKVQPAGKRIGKDDRRRGKPRPSVQALKRILDAVARGELTTDEASVLLGNLEVPPGTTMLGILDLVAKGELLPDEAAVFVGGDRSRPSSQTQPSTPGVPYGLIDEAGHQELIEIHPGEGELPPDAPSQQEAPATAQPGDKPTRRRASRRPKKT